MFLNSFDFFFGSVRYLEKIGSKEWDDDQLEREVDALLLHVPETLKHIEATRNLV